MSVYTCMAKGVYVCMMCTATGCGCAPISLAGINVSRVIQYSASDTASPCPACPPSQSLFVLLLLPVSAAAHGMSLSHLPDYVAQGCACIMGGSPSCGADCSAAPLLPLLYVAANLIFNISILMLLRRLGTVTTSLIASCLVPLSIFAFTLPLPYLVGAARVVDDG